ncbi:phosphate acyltransferase PlsX [Dongshaea marina]|uniref:phosphate acyltransferase PlsX n=1 Tax=Dongshaea marina TaxID=2047966 RepID=UPI000D3E23E8|nr:phosphate acyltransferase PlsX [Dongshaea marina]
MADLTIALDAMGGDHGPRITVPAVREALFSCSELHIILVGPQAELLPYLSQCGLDQHPRISVHHCSEVVPMDAKPAVALRAFKDSSMRRALELVRDKLADACVSAGNTGALMAMAKHILRPLSGVNRPALIKPLPQVAGQTFLLDLGANVDCDAGTLFQFALMGSALANTAGLRQPKIALLNIGEEANKGTEAVRSCAKRLSACSQVNYVGYLEASALFSGKADVVVCDGFVGNVALKSCEGTARFMLQMGLARSKGGLFDRLLSRWWKKRLILSSMSLNPDQYNGASLLGLRGIVVKSHGSAGQEAFSHAIHQAAAEVKGQLTTKIMDRLNTVLLDDGRS